MTKILKREANYPITIPAKVRFDLRLTANEKLLYGELYTFGGMARTFKVSNQHLADLYHVTVRSISTWLNKLVRCGYIEIDKSLDKNERIISFVEGVDPLDRDGYLYDEEVGHEEVIEAVAEPSDKYDYTVDAKVDPEVIEAEMTERFGAIPDHVTPEQREQLLMVRESLYYKLHSKNRQPYDQIQNVELRRSMFIDSEVKKEFDKLKNQGVKLTMDEEYVLINKVTARATEQFNKEHGINCEKDTSMEENFHPLEKKFSMVEANFQQEDNFQGLEN
ncbi:helix-turn-helix domain-containing protein, partial [Ligilactobacillus agilis]